MVAILESVDMEARRIELAPLDQKSLTVSFDERLDRFVRSAFLSGFFSSNVPVLDRSPSADFELLAASWVNCDGAVESSEVTRRRKIVVEERRRLEIRDRDKLAKYSRFYDRGTMACFALLITCAVLSIVLTMQADRVGGLPLTAGGVLVAMFGLVAVRLSRGGRFGERFVEELSRVTSNGETVTPDVGSSAK